MRRVVTPAVVLALAVAAAATSAAGWASGPAQSAPRSKPLMAAAGRSRSLAGVGRVKVVRYAGYRLDVPAAWPVYRLDRDPAQCVRYDIHAVYLGQPGADQVCPAHLVGRVATISLAVSSAGAPWPAGRWHPLPIGQWQAWAPAGVRQGAAGPAAVTEDSQDGELRAVLQRHDLTVTATYGDDKALVGELLHTLRWAGHGVGGAPAPVRAASLAMPAAGGTLPSMAAGVRHPLRMRGFDTCATPSLPTMRRFGHAFSVVAVYMGGPEAACGWGNLSRTWVAAATRLGWALMPTYVGPQAPCTPFSVRIRPGRAEAQGRAAARHAVALAHALRIGRHAPLYDDMEAYNGARSQCRNPVLAFLDGWTRQLHAEGYRSGVYSSASAAAADLGRTTTVYGHPIAKPDSMWFGLWDHRANLNGRPYVLDEWWAFGHRVKQWKGGHWRRVDGAWLDIDSDVVAGLVYRHR